MAAAVREAEETEASAVGLGLGREAEPGGPGSARGRKPSGEQGLVIDGASFSPAVSPPRLPAEIDRSGMEGGAGAGAGAGHRGGREVAREQAERRARGIVHEATADAASRLPGAYEPAVDDWKADRLAGHASGSGSGSGSGGRGEEGGFKPASGASSSEWVHRTAARRAQLEAAFGGLQAPRDDEAWSRAEAGPRAARDTRIDAVQAGQSAPLPSPRMAEALRRAQETLMRAPQAPRAPSLSEATDDSGGTGHGHR